MRFLKTTWFSAISALVCVAALMAIYDFGRETIIKGRPLSYFYHRTIFIADTYQGDDPEIRLSYDASVNFIGDFTGTVLYDAENRIVCFGGLKKLPIRVGHGTLPNKLSTLPNKLSTLRMNENIPNGKYCYEVLFPGLYRFEVTVDIHPDGYRSVLTRKFSPVYFKILPRP
jgi:hypothetical protein